MDAPADTLNYFIAGYSVIFGVMLVYLISLIVRFRNLRQDEKNLEEMEDK
jgi:TRAP-type C4-dicarboxylate transport system permease small subunit